MERLHAAGLEWLATHIHPRDRDRALQLIQTAAERGADSWAQEYSFRRADGSFAHGLARGSNLALTDRPLRASPNAWWRPSINP